tara:strand:+ start:1929 stop:2126 length:198 start_codon:yes stop_codon:yes gene_type:complete
MPQGKTSKDCSKRDLVQKLFEKMVNDNSRIAKKCVKETVPNEEMKAVVDNFLKTRYAKKKLCGNK